MANKYKALNKIVLLILAIMLTFPQYLSPNTIAASQIRLVIDGKDFTQNAAPVIENDRTLVPIRVITEQLDGEVEWNNAERSVKITKGDMQVVLKIDSHLIEINQEGKIYTLVDVPPKIINDRTYVPLRLVGNLLGISVEWDNANRIVRVDSNIISTFEPFFDVKFLNIDNGQAITGKTSLQISTGNTNLNGAAEIKYLLLDPKTVTGKVISRGTDLTSQYQYIPYVNDNGEKVLVAAIYDGNGNFTAGDALEINVNVVPSVQLTGISNDQIIDSTVGFGIDTNFVPTFVKYEITNIDKPKATLTDESDPFGSYNWAPDMEDSGNYSVKAIAYDENGNPHESPAVFFKADIARKLTLTGIPSNGIIDKPVSLLASRNFSVSETQYILRDSTNGNEQVIATIPYGNYTWFPEPDLAGNKEVFVRVRDGKGAYYESQPISVNILSTPKLILSGIGPKQVLTEPVKLKTINNVKLTSVNYVLINPNTGARIPIATNQDPSAEYTYTPTISGDWKIQVEGTFAGNTIKGEEIPFKIYLGKIYGPQPVIEKDKFLGMASGLAVKSWKKTGMSAALQTAQSILETGWGQSVPTDKYTGKLSNNLFGIKGSGPNGSVTSNTWEEYDGIKFRIDADFRAYKSVNESWEDHKEFLKKDRYQILRDVMYDSTQGAWALRRAGYATDSQYPIKLMNLIKQYNLLELDKVSI